MAKNSKTPNFITIVNEISAIAKSKGIAHLFAQDEQLNGREVTVKGNKLLNFGSCSYLGLELDTRLIEGGVDALRRYGSQFSSSRTYISLSIYEELEGLLSKIFGRPVILSTSSSLGHQAVIPIIIEDNDAIILDQQAHISMQDAVQKLQLRGVNISVLRHNRLDDLEQKIGELYAKHERIWYFLDGVYSMYGDFAPIHELNTLLDKYKKLYLYIDDAHGMSWTGLNGAGYILSQIALRSQIVLTTSLAKGFASAGGVFILPDEEMYWKVKHWGGPLTYSGPQQPAVIGASIASAKIHFSNEIYAYQESLLRKIEFCNTLIAHYNLPLISETNAPIFFIGLGLTKVGYNLVHRLSTEGLYTNLGIFPAVPETCTGIRFTITNHHTLADIEKLIERIHFHLPKALQEEDRTMDDVTRSFKSLKKRNLMQGHSEGTKKDLQQEFQKKEKFIIKHETSIENINEEIWDNLLGVNGYFNWKGLLFLEKVFKNNDKPEDNWDFHYYLISDKLGKPILATFFTSLLTKEDMLSSDIVSAQIEQMRVNDRYYLTSKTLMMGSLITNGDHLYIDKFSKEWKEALMALLDMVWAEQEKQNAMNLLLRDFKTSDQEVIQFLSDQGFIKIEIPDTHEMENFNFASPEDFIKGLSHKKRYHLNKDVLQFKNYFDVRINEKYSNNDLEYLYTLYENVANHNLEINNFKFPRKLFSSIAESNDWDIITLYLNVENLQISASRPVAVGFAYKNKSYCPLILGLDYKYLEEYKVYKQLLYQTILRAVSLKVPKIYWGITASLEKRKLGSKAIDQVAFMQMKDHYNSDVIRLIPNSKSYGTKYGS